ncbi:hypothetical protein B5E87_00295 [Massilimicrobiota sp. An142]|uniref:hypothetical protein n=1 Tax=Massilimicrobiota sp. An142 TaxID=1965564 RepID=UPI000B365864|nr:hypothetical protein [Massilimicrobiota sp. An142]OUQ15045.1 hypothetical protein B5E87_00295 [Massilimicrobiota sp. An142]
MSLTYPKGSIFDKCILENYIKEIYIDSVGETFYIRKLTVKEYEPIASAALKNDKAIKEGKDVKTTDLTITALIQSLCDKDGRRLLSPTDFDTVKNFDNEIASIITNEVLRLNNPDFEEIKKK